MVFRKGTNRPGRVPIVSGMVSGTNGPLTENIKYRYVIM